MVAVVGFWRLGEEAPAPIFTPLIGTDRVAHDLQERLARDRTNITAALKQTGGKVSGKDGAAELLGIKPTTLASRMASLGIEKSGTNA